MFVGLRDGDPAKDFADISYDGDCDDWRNAQIVDIFFFSHLIGYAAMAYSVRSVPVAWVVSIGFEFIELSLKNWMPNFKEVRIYRDCDERSDSDKQEATEESVELTYVRNVPETDANTQSRKRAFSAKSLRFSHTLTS